MRAGRKRVGSKARHCSKCGRRLYRKRYNGRLEDRTAFLKRKTCGGTGNTPKYPGVHKKNACQYASRNQWEIGVATLHHQQRR